MKASNGGGLKKLLGWLVWLFEFLLLALGFISIVLVIGIIAVILGNSL